VVHEGHLLCALLLLLTLDSQQTPHCPQDPDAADCLKNMHRMCVEMMYQVYCCSDLTMLYLSLNWRERSRRLARSVKQWFYNRNWSESLDFDFDLRAGEKLSTAGR
jgi:hypothetical protein